MDPAAEFLSREQEQLGDIDKELEAVLTGIDMKLETDLTDTVLYCEGAEGCPHMSSQGAGGNPHGY